MIVKDLLGLCSVDDIVTGIMRIAGVDEKDRPNVYRSLAEFIKRIQDIEPVGSGYVILGILYREDCRDIPDVSLFSKKEIAEQFDVHSEVGSIADEAALSDAEVDRLAHIRCLPESYAFEFSPWNEVLGYEVSEENVREVGAAQILASVIYEMTFCGFTEEEVEEERKKLDEAIAEVEEINKLSEEERRKHYKTIEEVFDELGIKDERTNDEKEAYHIALCREALCNNIRTYHALRKYVES